MTTPQIIAGCAILYPGTGPAHDSKRSHMCVVVGETAQDDFLLIPICTHHANCDETCIILSNEGWSSISRKSYAAYYEAKKVPKKSTIDRVKRAEITYLGVIPTKIFTRILSGITASTEVEPWFVKEFKAKV